MRRLLPRTLAGQLGLVLVVALLVVQMLAVGLFLRERGEGARRAFAETSGRRMVETVRLIEAAPPDLTRAILRTASGSGFRLRIAPRRPSLTHGASELEMAERLSDALGKEPAQVIVRSFSPHRRLDGPSERRRSFLFLAVQLGEGPSWLVGESRRPRTPSFPFAFLMANLVSALAVAGVALWMGRRLARPLTALTQAATRFGQGEDVQPLTPEGPEEIARAAEAFNTMRERLERYVRDRTVMLAALGHDLRTPLTSLRLRAEFVEDEEGRARMIETLDEMSAMTEEALALARDDAVAEPRRPLDLTALAESVAEDLRERGHEADVVSPERIVARCRPRSTRRALTNLANNAVAYGQRVSLTVTRDGEGAAILIEDDGPGIAPLDRARVFEPFVRLDASRNRETGGTGLGLAIARSLMRAQGGDVTLDDAPSGGLRARMSFAGAN